MWYSETAFIDVKHSKKHIFHKSLSVVHLHPGEKMVDSEAGRPTLHPWLLDQHLSLELLREEKSGKKEEGKTRGCAGYLHEYDGYWWRANFNRNDSSVAPPTIFDRWLSREPSKTHLNEDLAPDDMR